eukprot:jgi/Chlat1/2139/Chrsp17S02844
MEKAQRESDGSGRIRKAALERVLREGMLGGASALNFQHAIKALNGRVLSVLDRSAQGSVEIAGFFATVAPLCAGESEERLRAAYDALARSHGGECCVKNVFTLLTCVTHGRVVGLLCVL